jgi:hypothetical protein
VGDIENNVTNELMALLPICYGHLAYITGMVLFTSKDRYDNFSVGKILMTRQVRYGYPTKTELYDSCGFCHKLGSKLIPCTPTPCDCPELRVGGDYATGNEYI